MNKGIKETKSETKQTKNVFKIASRMTEISSEKKSSPTRRKDRSLSINSLVTWERAESPKKCIQKEIKPKMIHGNLIKKACDFQKSVGFSSSIEKHQGDAQFFEESIKIKEKNQNPSNPNFKLNQKQQFFEELIAREGSIEKLLDIKKTSNTVYDIDGMSPSQIRESLARIDDKTAKPFCFLNDIINHPEEAESKMSRDATEQELNSSDIDLQLSSLVRRVELNRTLLERANQRIKDMNFLAERNKIISIRDTNYDEESFLKIKDTGDTSKEPKKTATDLTAVSHPAVEELQKTMKSTIEMLGYVHKMSSGDLASGEMPPELTEYLSTTIIAKDNL